MANESEKLQTDKSNYSKIIYFLVLIVKIISNAPTFKFIEDNLCYRSTVFINDAAIDSEVLKLHVLGMFLH